MTGVKLVELRLKDLVQRSTQWSRINLSAIKCKIKKIPGPAAHITLPRYIVKAITCWFKSYDQNKLMDAKRNETNSFPGLGM